jgi:L-threonylcarbamoyladenylate synthase
MEYRLSSNIMHQVEKAAEILLAGGVIAFPTDTVYGIGANPYIKEAVDKVYKVKQRPRDMPVPILLAEEEQLGGIVASISTIAKALMKQFWPGGLTLVLPKHPSFLVVVYPVKQK